ncbi:MAG TPA: transglycosylase SLT domain-containing protein [Oculatellaceae cyanobacterium]
MRIHRQREWDPSGDFREHSSWQAEAARHAYGREHYGREQFGRQQAQHNFFGYETNSYYQHPRGSYYQGHNGYEGQNYYGHRPHHAEPHMQNYYSGRHHMRGHTQSDLPNLELTTREGRHHHRREESTLSGAQSGVHPRAAEMAQLVARHAKELGMTQNATVAAVAAMLQESGGDPNKPGDYGRRDHKPHSFGLFQLNFKGGEGTANHLTPAQALDPDINARTALKYFRANQNRTSNPGQLALISQNPSDPNYVSNVNRWVGEAKRLLGI